MKEYPQKIITHIFNLLMIVLGIIGIVGGFYSSLEFPRIALFGLPILVMIGWIFYYTYVHSYHQLRHGCYVLIIFLIIMICVAYTDLIRVFIDDLKDVIIYDYYLSFSSLLPTKFHLSNSLPIIILIIIGVPVVLLIVSLICQKNRNTFKLVCLFFLYFFPALILHPLNLYTSYCFIAFFMYAFLFYCILKYQDHQIYLRLFYTLGLVITLCLSHFFLEQNPLFYQHSTTVLTNIVHWIDHNRFVNGANITGASFTVDGTLPTGNISTDNQVALTVDSQVPFSSYLRSYSLAHYDNNQWNNDNMETQDTSSLQIHVNYLYRLLDTSESIKVSIDSPSTNYQIVPYYARVDEQLIDDAYYPKLHESFYVYQDHDDPLNVYPRYEQAIGYNSYVYENYLDVPDEIDEKLDDFLNEKFEEKYGYSMIDAYLTYQQWADFVKDILEEETSYTLNAGSLPRDSDFVEYFLFENKKGSCTHYATTGALMLRSMGIPTRFVKGFVLKESDFVDGKAEVKNNRSHAWIEIYIDDVGWIPYEMTPSDTNTVESVGDRLDQSQTQETPQNPTTAETPQQPQENNETPTATQTDHHHFFNACLVFLTKYQNVLINVSFIIVVFMMYRIVTKKWFFIKVKKYNLNIQMMKYYSRLMKISRFGESIDKDIEQLALKAKFSQHHITEKEFVQMQTYYQLFVKETYQSLVWYKKIVYKYLLGYI